jgi:hypothetical protein
LTRALLVLLCGVGDGAREPWNSRQWSVDTAAELQSQIEILARLSRLDGLGAIPVVRAETVEEVVTWISENASLRRQQDAVKNARPHDWTRARRITRLAIGLLDRAVAAASPEQHVNDRALFTRLAVAWARILFPVLLALVRSPKQRRSMAKTLLAAAAIVRGGPARACTAARPERRGGRQPRRGQGGVPGGMGAAASAIARRSRRDVLNLSLSVDDPSLP